MAIHFFYLTHVKISNGHLFRMVVNEEDVVNIMGGMEHAGGIKLNDHKRKLKNRLHLIEEVGISCLRFRYFWSNKMQFLIGFIQFYKSILVIRRFLFQIWNLQEIGPGYLWESTAWNQQGIWTAGNYRFIRFISQTFCGRLTLLL